MTKVVQDQLFLGVDGGGSKCKARIESVSGKVIGMGVAGPANVARDIDLAKKSIVESVALAIKDAGLSPKYISELIVGAGLAGANLPASKALITNWQHPFKQLFIATDAHIACMGAHNGHDGAVIITGTGSCGLVSVDGEVTSLGGYGFISGDKGGGSWLGAEAIRRSLNAADGLAPETRLLAAIYQRLAVDNALAISENFVGAPASRYAQIAPLVFDMAEQGDDMAIDIVGIAAAYINALAVKLLEKNPPKLSIIGGVSQRIEPWLSREVRAKLSAPIQQPEYGAIHFAKRQYSALLGY